ncbi:MAG: hypothetical protein QM731_11815 [Chitinophagaceae bacterium]
MKKILSTAALLLLSIVLLTGFITLTYRSPASMAAKQPPHSTVTIQNTTASPSSTVTLGLAYYDASNNFLGSASRTVASGSSATDTETFLAYKVVVTVTSGFCTTLDFWDSTYTYDGGCASNVLGVSGGTFYFISSSNYLLLVNNTGCR